MPGIRIQVLKFVEKNALTHWDIFPAVQDSAFKKKKKGWSVSATVKNKTRAFVALAERSGLISNPHMVYQNHP